MSHALLAEVALALLLMSCSRGANAPPPVVSLPDSEPLVVEREPSIARTEKPPEVIAWQHDLESALALAEKQQRPRLLYFRAAWAVTAAVIERELWPDPQVRLATRDVVSVFIDLTEVEDPASEERAARHEVQRVPTIVIADRRGKEVARFEGVTDAASLIHALKRAR